jgi:hypothetical protein
MKILSFLFIFNIITKIVKQFSLLSRSKCLNKPVDYIPILWRPRDNSLIQSAPVKSGPQFDNWDSFSPHGFTAVIQYYEVSSISTKLNVTNCYAAMTRSLGIRQCNFLHTRTYFQTNAISSNIDSFQPSAVVIHRPILDNLFNIYSIIK